MTRKNKTRNGVLAQKKGVCIAVIPFVEADILGDGSAFVELPKYSLITAAFSRLTVASGTASSTLDVYVSSNLLISAIPVFSLQGTNNEPLQVHHRYVEIGGELIIRAGTVSPATGSLVGELVVEYVELIRNIGEYTTFLDS